MVHLSNVVLDHGQLWRRERDGHAFDRAESKSRHFVLQTAHGFTEALGRLVEFTKGELMSGWLPRSGGSWLRESAQLPAIGLACPR